MSARSGASGEARAAGTSGDLDASSDGPLGNVLTLAQIKRFVCYCRAKCAPRLSDEAARTLQSEYVAIRDSVRQRAITTGSEEAIPITVCHPMHALATITQLKKLALQVRQLEALVRVSEALSKMRLSAEVSPRDVREVHAWCIVTTVGGSRIHRARAGSASVQSVDNVGCIGWAQHKQRGWWCGSRRWRWRWT